LVRTYVPVNQAWDALPWLAPYARVLHIQNTGAAFGLFQDAGLFFAVVAIVVSAVIIVYSARLGAGQWAIRVALGMQLGGALGNLIDRLTFGPVTDFISIGNFAIFNIADASISTGVALLALLMLLDARRERREAQNEPPMPPALDVGEPSWHD
jgi:signal peptidase II